MSKNNRAKGQNKDELCSLCKFLGDENPKIAVYQLKDEEFGTLEPVCDFHIRFQLDLIWKEDNEDIIRIEKGIEKENEPTKRWLEITENKILEEKLNKWERLKKNHWSLGTIINNYAEILRSKKNQLELELYR